MDYYSQYGFALLGASVRRDYQTRDGEDRYYQAHDFATLDRYITRARRAASYFARRFRFRFGLIQAYAK